MDWFDGIVVGGYKVASGLGEDRRFPGGTIHLQRPFFLARGIDLSPYFSGTLNVDLAPVKPQLRPEHAIFDGTIQWFPDIEERFVLSPIEIDVKGQRYAGLWYYPDPVTKPDHFQKASVAELLLPWINGVAVGEKVVVGF